MNQLIFSIVLAIVKYFYRQHKNMTPEQRAQLKAEFSQAQLDWMKAEEAKPVQFNG